MIAIAAALAALPLHAQSTSPPPSQPESIGPRELRDFSLPGTTPAPADPPPQSQPEAAPPTRTAPATEPRPRAPRAQQPAERRPAPAEEQPLTQPAPDTPQDLGSQPAEVAPPPPAETPYVSQPLPDAAPLPSSPAAATPQSQWPMIAWLAAALLAALAAAYALYRRRARSALAQAANLEAFVPVEPPPPPPKPVQTAPETPPPAGAGAGAGLVSARLRPSLELELVPVRAVVDDRQATIDFSIVAFNTGNAPARDVKIEVAMLNAGPTQDQEIGRFFAEPAGIGDPVDGIAPMGQINLSSRVSLPLDQIRALEVAGRKLFVPLLAFNALYRWGNAGEGQTSRSYLVGREGNGEKMAPLRLDLGPRIFRNLGARRHHLQMQR